MLFAPIEVARSGTVGQDASALTGLGSNAGMTYDTLGDTVPIALMGHPTCVPPGR